MASKTIKVTIKQRYDTEYNWSSNNPVLASGEIAFSSDKDCDYKVGDGTSRWGELPYQNASLYSAVLAEASLYSTKALQDNLGQQIDSTYVKGLSVLNNVITYTKGDNTTGKITVTNVEPDYTGATADDDGTHGLVPKPVAGKQKSYLKGDGNWTEISGPDITSGTINSDRLETITRTNTNSTASPAHGSTFTAVDSITTDQKGRITAVNTKTVTLPANDNQNSFSKIKVGEDLIEADGVVDTLEMVAGTNVTLSADTTDDSVTINVPTVDAYNSTSTSPVNGKTIANAIDTLDVASVGGTGKYISAISETDGKISATVTDTKSTYDGTDTIAVNGKAIKDAIDTLDVAEVGGTGKYISAISETNGKISATVGNIAYNFGNVKVGEDTIEADVISDTLEIAAGTNITLAADTTNDKVTVSMPTTDTYDGTSTVPVNGKTIKAAIETLDVASSGGTGKYISAISETDGKISATATDTKSTYDGTDTTAVNGKAIKAAIDTLDVASVGGTGKYISAISETDGKISATANDIAFNFGNVKVGTSTIVADAISDTLEIVAGTNVTLAADTTDDKVTINVPTTDSYDDTSTSPVNGKTIKAAIDTLDVGSVGGTGKYISAISETNGKISATANDIPKHFGSVKVGTSTIEADVISDTLELVAGTNVTLTPNTTDDSVTIASADRYVNNAAFVDDTTASSNSPVKMTLTRAGSDSATVVANIPKVSSSSAGVAPKGASVSTQSQTTKFLREDGSWAAPSYKDTTYAFASNSTDTINVTPYVNGTAQTATSFTINSISASKITGVLSIDNIPAAALERVVTVANDTARFALTTSDVQLGDTVKVTATKKMYMVKDTSKLNQEAGYEEYVSTADWSTITNVPTTYSGYGLSVGGGLTGSNTGTISHSDTSSQSSVSADGRKYITGVTLDTYGHVTGLTTGTETVVNTDRYVNNASFVDDTTASSNSPVKMTLTRAGSDSETVVANIPKVSSSSAGVAPKGAAVNSQSQGTKFLREDGTWAAPSYTQISSEGAASGSHKHSYTPSGSVSSSFTGSAVTSTKPDTTNVSSVGSSDHTHSVTASGSVSSSFTGSEVNTGKAIVTNATTSVAKGDHTHSVTASGSVSSSFTGSAVTSGATATASRTDVSTPSHTHSVTASGSVSSSFSGSAVTSAAADSTNKVSVAKGDHTHSVTASGSVSSSFSGSAVTSGEADSTNKVSVAKGDHTHSVTASGSVSSSFTGSAVTSGGPSGTATVASSGHTHSIIPTYNSTTKTLTFKSNSGGPSGTATVASSNHTHSVTASGSVSSSFSGSAVTSGATATASRADVSTPSHTHSVTASGSVSSSFTGSAVTSGATGTTSRTDVSTPSHTHSVTASGSVSSSFTGSAVTSDVADSTNKVSVAKGDHTHSVTASGSVSSSFTGSAVTSGATATTSRTDIPNADHIHAVTASGSVSSSFTGSAVTSGIPSKTTSLPNINHTHNVTASGSVSSSFSGSAGTTGTPS